MRMLMNETTTQMWRQSPEKLLQIWKIQIIFRHTLSIIICLLSSLLYFLSQLHMGFLISFLLYLIQLFGFTNAIRNLNVILQKVLADQMRVISSILFFSQMQKDSTEVPIFFFHFLMMTSALCCSTSSQKIFHQCKYFNKPSQVSEQKMLMINFQKPIISFFFIHIPMFNWISSNNAFTFQRPSLTYCFARIM